MSTALAVPSSTALTERKAAIMLGEEQIAVRLSGDGFLTRSIRTIRLDFGTDLYAAVRGEPGPKDKVTPYQPGYMRIVHAMGGQLVCPPTVIDPATGRSRPNPYVEFYQGTSIVRSVTATAVCAVRNPVTGQWHASVQTQVQDAEHILRQALMGIEREEIVRYLSEEEYLSEKAAGKTSGWFPLNIGAGVWLLASLKAAGVRDAIKTFQNQAATLRQRACSKAERLAADHNPVTRRIWEYRALKKRIDRDGNEAGARYAEIQCVAWIDHREQGEMERFLAGLAAQTEIDGVAEVIVGEHYDQEDSEVDDDIEGDGPTPTRQLEERPPVRMEPERPRERVVVDEPIAAPAPKAAPVDVPPAAPAVTRSAAAEKLLGQVNRMLGATPGPDIWPPAIRDALAQRDGLDDTGLMKLRDDMKAALERGL